jgi:hypothetical protein
MKSPKRRRPQPATPVTIPWTHRGIPDKPTARRRMLREISRAVDDEAIYSILYWALSRARNCEQRAAVTELARIKAADAAAGRRTIPADEIVYLNDLTPAQAKRLKTMTTAQLKALAKRQARAREKAVRP